METLNHDNRIAVNAGIAPYTGGVDVEWHAEAYDLVREEHLKPKGILEIPRCLGFRTERYMDFYPPENESAKVVCLSEPITINGKPYSKSTCTFLKKRAEHHKRSLER
jgi:hypothetical protein